LRFPAARGHAMLVVFRFGSLAMHRNAWGLVLCTVSFLATAPAVAQPPPKHEAKPAAHKSAPPAGSSLRLTEPEAEPSRRYDGDPSPAVLSLRLPAPADPARTTAKASPAELTARYLPPVLVEPDRPNGARSWEIDLPEARKDWSPGPFVHPAGKSAEDLAASCTAPPDPDWLTGLKAGWALDGYGNAEPLPGQPSYWPFPCY
jgi:hypothetical protein